jgi:amino acid transporter
MPRRRMTLLQAVSLNMAMMVGMGPFITIPLFVAKLDGPEVLLGWVLGAVLAMADGLVWCELATAFPGSGGTLHFYDAVYGNGRLGRLLKFLFVWQFVLSAPLELASGGIGLGQYAGFLVPEMREMTLPIDLAGWTWNVGPGALLAIGFVAVCVVLAYRRIEVAGWLMVLLWAGMLATMATILGVALLHFDADLAFASSGSGWTFDRKFAIGLGGALGIAMYDFLGYYQICYLGDEVDDPARTMPRSILISVAAVAALYLAMNVGIMGVLPRAEVIATEHVASDFMKQALGGRAAVVVTGLVLWTGVASLFAGLLGYSRVPYAAALSGDFFAGLGRIHPTGDFPHRSLLVIGGLTALACLFDLSTVIAALLASRVWVQFIGQIDTVLYMRSDPALRARMSFKMALFPLPAILALVGWLWVFGTSDWPTMAFAAGSIVAGVAAFLVRDRLASRPDKSASPEV